MSRYEFETVSQCGDRFLWTYPDYELTTAKFAIEQLRSHGEYGTVSSLSFNLIDEPHLGLIYLGKVKK